MMRKISIVGLILGIINLTFGAEIGGKSFTSIGSGAILNPRKGYFGAKQLNSYKRNAGSSYSAQSGTQTSGSIVTDFDKGDYMTYDSVDFGSAGSTKGIILSHSKANHGGTVEVRLGDKEGPVIAEFTPAKVGSNWNQYHSAYIGITDVTGVHDVTFVGKDGSDILNLAWFELSDFPERSETYAQIPASQYSDQRGTSFHGPNTSVGWFDRNDYMTYSSVNFGSFGSTNSLNLRYAKANQGGRVEIRLGGPDGWLIGEYKPANTKNNWHAYETVNVGISGVEGINDLTFVGRDVSGVWNLLWFEPSSNGETKSNAPSVTPTSSPQKDPVTDSPTSPIETSEPTSATSSFPSSLPTTKVEDLCAGKTKAQCPKATCRFSKKKKVKVCEAMSKHNCSVHQSENACNSTNTGVCKWNNGICTHQCSGMASKACKKKKSSITNAKICKLKKISNECFGCHSKNDC